MMVKELELISKAAKKLKKEYSYSNEGEAFAHLFVKNYSGIDDNETAEACQAGYGGDDKGIDAFRIDEENNTIYVFGITMKEGSLGPAILDDIERARVFFTSDLKANIKESLKQTWMSYRECKEKGFPVTYVRAFLGTLNKEAEERLKKLQTEFEKDGWTIEISDKKDTIGTCLTMKPPKGPNVEFDILDKNPLVPNPSGCLSAAVFSVRGNTLANLIIKHPNKIFVLNLRQHLGYSKTVNKKIIQSITDPATQPLFWYLNLGIDAICDHFSPPKTTKNGLWKIKITNFRIVNGCQTCHALAKDPSASKKVSVMVRLVQTKDTELGRDIAIAKNRQTAIKERDLMALDDWQLKIQHEMDLFSPSFFYQRRDGEWNSVKNTSRGRRKHKKRWVDNKECAKAYLAIFRQKPFEAKHKTKSHFQQGEGGLYDEVFGPKLESRDLVVAHEIYSIVTGENKKIRKEYRRLMKESASRALGEDEKRKLKRISYLVNADTYIAALIWYLSKKHLKPNEIEEHLISLDKPLVQAKEKNLIKLYGVVCKPIVTLVATVERLKTQDQLYFSVRNYFARPDTYQELKNQADLVDAAEVRNAIGLR